MTQYPGNEQDDRPLVQFSVPIIVAYTWRHEGGIDVSRMNEVSDWLMKRRGRRVAENVYIFGKANVPSFAEFKEAFSPLRDGECIVVISSAKEALSLEVYGQPSLVKDFKITVADKMT